MNADKTEYICFNQKRDISTLNDDSLKLVDKFTFASHLLKLTSICDKSRPGLLSIGYRSYRSKAYPIK